MTFVRALYIDGRLEAGDDSDHQEGFDGWKCASKWMVWYLPSLPSSLWWSLRLRLRSKVMF